MRHGVSLAARIPLLLVLPACAQTGVPLSAQQLGPEFVQRHVSVPGAVISYFIRNAPGPTLVLIPGSFDPAAQWSDVIAGLDKRLRIEIVELRGHGGSWPPPSRGTIPEFAKDVLAAVNHAGIRRFYVGGHSIGGMIAIEAAAEYPQRLDGVISVEGWTHYSVAQDAFQGQIRSTLSPALRARALELRKPVTTRWTRDQMREFAEIWKHWNGYQILERTRLPVLELWGDRGRPTPPSRVLMKIPDRPNIQLMWMHGASHVLPLERPAEVAAAIDSFIRRTSQ